MVVGHQASQLLSVLLMLLYRKPLILMRVFHHEPLLVELLTTHIDKGVHHLHDSRLHR